MTSTAQVSMLAKACTLDQNNLHVKLSSERTVIVVGKKGVSGKRKTILTENSALLIAY